MHPLTRTTAESRMWCTACLLRGRLVTRILRRGALWCPTCDAEALAAYTTPGSSR